jgi:nicotinate-nucleotide--dimethylbenzimidazole phosphoribosyltransferase
MTPHRPTGAFAAARAAIEPIDATAERSAREHHDRLTKPAGSLGRLEALGIQLAGIAGSDPPPVPRPAAVAVFAGDHGVVAEGVTPWPQEVTAQMVANFVAGGAAINVLARQAGASVTVIDVGVAADLDALGLAGAPGLWRRRVRAGTANLATGPALTDAEVRAALDVGASVATELVDDGARALVTGEMGIGNTTASAALIAALVGRPPVEVTGRGTGVDDRTLARKVAVIETALGRLPRDADPIRLLAEVGGLEIAALVGFIVRGASRRVPVVVDGVIAGAALLAAAALVPAVLPYVVAGHRSTEPGASAVLSHLGIEPVLDLGLRLGEGSGACLALGVLEAAALVLREMATFDAAGVTEKG